MTVSPETRIESIRGRLTSIQPDLADEAEQALREALKATKRVRAQRVCLRPGCSCTHIEFVEVQDSAKVLDALKLAIEQTEGRPGVADQDEATALTITRTTYDTVDAPHALALLQGALEALGDTAPKQLHALRAELVSSLPHAREDQPFGTAPGGTPLERLGQRGTVEPPSFRPNFRNSVT